MFSCGFQASYFFEHQQTATSLPTTKEVIKVTINMKDLEVRNQVTKKDTFFL